MTLRSLPSLRFCTCAILWAASCLLVRPAAAQEDNDLIQTVIAIPPDAGLLQPNAVEMAINSLEWKQQQQRDFAEHLEVNIEKLRVEIEKNRELASRVAAESQFSDLALANESVRNEIMRQILGTLLESKIEVAAHEALIIELEKQAEKELALQEQRLQDLRAVLDRQTQRAKERVKELKEQYRTNLPGSLDEAHKLEELNQVANSLELRLEMAEVESPAPLNQQLLDAQLELKRLKAQEEMAAIQLEEISQAIKLSHRFEQFNSERTLLQERLSRLTERFDEVSLDAQQTEVLLNTIRKRWKAPQAEEK